MINTARQSRNQRQNPSTQSKGVSRGKMRKSTTHHGGSETRRQRENASSSINATRQTQVNLVKTSKANHRGHGEKQRSQRERLVKSSPKNSSQTEKNLRNCIVQRTPRKTKIEEA